MAPACLGAVLTCLSLVHLTGLEDRRAVYLAVAGGTAGLLLVAAALWWRGRAMTSHPAHAVMAACLLLAAADILAHSRLTGSLERTGELMLTLAAAAAVLLDNRWFYPTAGTLVGAWGAAALTGDPATRTFQLVALAVACTLCVAVARARAAAVDEFAEVHDAAALAVLDPLTGLVDRRGVHLLGDKLVAIARRESGAVGATFVEVPGLEEVRRTAGDEVADDLVVHLAGVLESVTRRTDVVARWGQDQFVLVTHGPGAPMDVLEGRIARVIEVGCPVPDGVWEPELQLGRAVLQPWDEGGLAGLLADAERDVYVRSGRRPPEPSPLAQADAAAAERHRAQAAGGQAASEVVAAAHTLATSGLSALDRAPATEPVLAPAAGTEP
jgi:diguanylate cyclase (GGDEF)-like protein